MTSAPILVTGGTGTLGRHVLPLLGEAGRKVRVLTRGHHAGRDGVHFVTGDLLRGEGIDAAVRGVEIVLHLAGGPKGDDDATRNLLLAASRAGVQHVVYVSVVGADRVPLSWLRSKHAAERAVVESGIAWSTLRAAQFHDLVLTVLATMTKVPVVPVPAGLRLQPVDARDVAHRLVELTLGPPAGRVPDLVGPRVYEMSGLLRGYLAATGRRRPTLPVRIPGKAGRAYRAGENLAAPGARFGTRTWEDFLSERADGVTAGGGEPENV